MMLPNENDAKTTARKLQTMICNETLEVIARMVNFLLDEDAEDRLGNIQQAFLSGRHILIDNIYKLCRCLSGPRAHI